MKNNIIMFAYGSLENVPPVINEGRSLAENGYVVQILSIRYCISQPKVEEISPRFKIRRMTLITRLIFGENDFFQLFRYTEAAIRSFFWGLFRGASLFIAHDLITLPYVFPLARLLNKRVVYRAHELWSEQAPNFPMASFWRRLDKYFSSRVDAIVTAETNRAQIYVKEFKAPKDPLVVFNCPRLIPRFESSVLRDILSQKGIKNKFVVYYQGGISLTRSIDKLIESMLYTSDDVSLVLVGKQSDSFLGWFNDFIIKHTITDRVVMLGFIGHGDKLFELCSGADIGIVFAKDDCLNNRFSGTASNKMFEYMMMGLPIIATDLLSYSQVVEQENVGLCVNSEDPKSIAGGIMKLYVNPELVNNFKKNALRLAKEKYNWEKEFPKLLYLYREMLSENV